MTICSLLRLRRIRTIALLSVLLCAASAEATITLSTTTRAGTSATATGTAINDLRCPGPVVIDSGSGTTTSHSTGSAEQVGIRFGEKKLTTCSYTHATLTLTCTDAFTTFSWELNTASTNGATDWTASGADAGAYYHDGGTEVHGKPVGVRVNGSDVVEGTCGSLANGQWCWGDADTIGSNRVYIQDASGDPDGQATGFVKVIYGDGEYIELQHADFNSGNPVYVYVDTKVSDDAITLMAAPTGASADETNVTVFQAVNPWTDLRYNYSVSCTGAVCIEDITNGDQRPGLTTTAIDETVGRGPIWAFVFKEGFDSDVAGAGGATITITANDDANGDTEDSQTIAVDEASWSGAAIKYLSSAGSDSNTGDDATAGGAWLTADKGIEWLFQTATPPAELVIVAGETVDNAGLTTVTSVAAKTGDRRVRSSVAGSKAFITVGANEYFIRLEGDGNADARFMDIDITKSGATGAAFFDCSDCVLLRVDIDSGTTSALTIGTGTDDSFDNVIWDSSLKTNNNSAGVYPIFYGGGDAGEYERRAIVGTRIDLTGGEHMMRAYTTNFLAAYNYASSDASSGTPGVGFWLRSSTTTNVPGSYQYIFANYIRWNDEGTGESAIDGIAISPEGSADAVRMDSVLIDSNFLYMANISQFCGGGGAPGACADVGIHVQVGPGKYFVAKNNVIAGFDSAFAKGGTTGALPDGRIFNNTAYTATASTCLFWKGGTNTGQASTNLKIINNATVAPNSTVTSSRVIENNHATLSTLQSTHALENCVDFGSVNTSMRVISTSYAFSAWQGVASKAAQHNITGSLSKDNDPRYALAASNDFRLCTAAGVPDASCAGASPCIDVGWDLPTVYYDYSGAVRNSDDIGAWDDDSTGMDMGGSGPSVGSFMLMGVGR